ncbi:MAG: hypothetical protein I8H68_09840 [Flavobacteriia bacterium]|nr:hypothetical protein [Flavobacteriia bacterium]
MKKILFLLTLLSFTFVYSQCFIEGNSQIKAGESEVYTIKNNTAQCADCHQWSSFGGNVSLEGDVKQHTIKVKGNAGGKTILSLEMLSDKGILRCSKNIDVVNPVSQENHSSTSACDVSLDSFKEVKVSDGVVSFVPAKSESGVKYEWTAEYENGDKKTSAEPTAQFSYSRENGIKTLMLRVTSSKCMRNFTKTYDANYWRFY